MIFRLFIILLCMLSLGACKEEYTYPNVFTELAEVQTDASGGLKVLTTDRGAAFTVGNFASTTKFTPDSLYRMLTVFEPIPGQVNTLFVHSARPVFSELPKPADSFEDGIQTDPVDIQSIWRSGNYLNMILRIQTKDKPHKFHFVDQGIYPYNGQNNQDTPANEENKKVLELIFYHDRGDDFEAFTTKYCFSIPLYPYEGMMKKGDIVRLQLNTYKEGAIVREFEF